MTTKCYTHYMHLSKLENDIMQEIFIPVRCKSWGCSPCRSIKARIVMDFIKRSFAGQSLFMLTFTDPHRGSALDAWETLGSRWNLFRTWAVKTFGKFQYVRIIEPHKKGGWPHMHVLVNIKMSDPKIRSMLKKWGYGYIFDNMNISVTGAAQYVSGYLTKKWPDGLADRYRRESKTRIVQASQSLGAIFTKKSSWSLVTRKVRYEEIYDYVWDVYKARFINDDKGARMISSSKCFVIESVPTSADREFCRKLGEIQDPVSIEDVEPTGLNLFGIQQTLLLER